MIVVALAIGWAVSSVGLALVIGRSIRIADDAQAHSFTLTRSVQDHAYAFVDAERRERGMLTRAAIARTPAEFAHLDRVRGQVEPAISDSGEVLITGDGRKMSQADYLKWLEDDMTKMGVDPGPVIHAEGM